tara:strand:+ start:305 stop:544 length:240 start_codon:yes stop_codon:yes gene_type:complete
MTSVLAYYVGGMKTMNKELAQYINTLLADRQRLLDERKDDLDTLTDFDVDQLNTWEETKWELGMIYKAQKSMDYFEEEY